MSKHDKALARLLSKPVDFAWSELHSLMNSLGFELRTTGGSGRKFIDSKPVRPCSCTSHIHRASSRPTKYELLFNF
jgi:hypothetical protein